MDGQRRECPIVETTCIQLNTTGGLVLVSASVDSIQMFPDERYNYLRVIHEDTVRAMFLGGVILAELVDNGIPITTRDSITTTEFEAWATSEAAVEAEDLQEEIDRFFDGY